MSAIAKRQSEWMTPSDLGQAMQLAEMLARSEFVPKSFRGKPGDVFAAMAMGAERGMGAMLSLTEIHVVNGIPGLSAKTMAALILASGKAEYFDTVEMSATQATIVTRRKGSPRELPFTYSMEDAKRAGLTGKDVWKSHPRAMLQARATSMAARAVYPDVIQGAYTPDELEEIAGEPIKATVIDECSAQAQVDDDETLRQAARDYAEALAGITAWDKRQCYSEIHQRAKAMMDDGAPRTVATIEQAYKAAHRDAPEEQE